MQSLATTLLCPYTTLFRSGTRVNCCPFQKNFSDIPCIHSVSLIRALTAESFHFKYRFTRSISSSVASACSVVGFRLGSTTRSEEHTSELQSLTNLVCRLLL